MKAWIPALVVLLAVLACGRKKENPDAEPPKPDFVETRGKSAGDAVAKMMGLLPEIANEHVYQRLGFRSLDEVKKAKPGTPIARIWLRCDSIKTYAPSKGENLEPLIFLKRWVFPLEVDKHARSTMVADSMADSASDGKLDWKVVEVGGANWAAMMDTILSPHSERNGIKPDKYSLVEIPALDQVYLAYPDKEGLSLLPLKGAGSPCWPMVEGMPMRLSAALLKLSQCKQLEAACTDPKPWKQDPKRYRYEPKGDRQPEVGVKAGSK